MKKIIVTGAAGLVGQNLMFEFEGKYEVVAIDRNKQNIEVLKRFHPKVKAICVDVSCRGGWEQEFKNADYLVILHAQISAKNEQAFVQSQVAGTKNVLEAAKKNNVKYIVHFSSSVVISVAQDDYSNTKKAQENLVKESGIPYVIFRPPLMFGWFDKKHLGWLSRFMEKTPVFPIPGHGRYLRQPLFVKDMCNVVMTCLKKKPRNEVLNIIGREKINFIDLIRKIRDIKGLKTIVIPIPIPIFAFVMKLGGLFSRDPPFTPDQLKALTAGDEFDVWPWWERFNVKTTPLEEALKITFTGKYSKIVLKR